MRLAPYLLTAALVLTTGHDVSAAEPNWAAKPFVYRADGKRIVEVIQDFAASQGVPVIVDPGVDGTVTGAFDRSGADFRRAMTKSFGVVWYFDGVTLYAYPSRSIQSKVFRMRGYQRAQVRQMLDSLGLGDPRFPLRYNETEQTLVAVGPPRHIELVGTVVATLDQRYGNDVGAAVLVVPLKFAFAADRMSGSVRLAGLASTLNELYGSGDAAGAPGGGSIEPMQAAVGSLLGTAPKQRTALETFGFKSASPTAPATLPRAPQGGQADSPGTDAPAPADKPHFQADEATNSIIVRGRSERLPQYEALIGKLDVAQDMIEIEATIIDVSSDEFESLGIEWDASGSRGRVTVSPGQSSGPSGSGPSLSGANITTLLSNAGSQLLSRIRALEGTGKARIVSRPKVLGAANRTATMIDKRVASVRVSGNLDANLFTVEAGTTLQVQPQIVNHPDRRDVRLTLYIQDGNFEGTVVDAVPIIKRTEISSDMSIPEGDSLLIGGITTESELYGRSGVSGLGRLPLIGGLFRNTERTKYRSERLFLLTPKIIGVAGSAPLAPALPNALPAPRPAPGGSAPAPAPAMPQSQSQPQPQPQLNPTAPSAPASAAPVSQFGPEPYNRGLPPGLTLAAAAPRPACAAMALGLAESQCVAVMPAPR